ncbi:hypothetical protein CI15_03250 [Paraburkholderia monticola]|uniref:Uncharacterized protein n=2 Tax=Paraburkholderia monticola TaxID=1399968 RepID=A0A149Q0V4_9BURK|nr:hypothetical protein CI15_03250 [Paraburkholderia monticola]
MVQLFFASRLTVGVPLVDGWAVWNRVMLFTNGTMGPFRYLLTPHGAHLHLAVYSVALLDERFANGHQYLMQAVSYAAILGCVVFFTWLASRLDGFRSASKSMKVLVAVGIALFVTNLGDTETLLQPFQVVMSVSRLAYVILLWLMIGALRRGTPLQYAMLLLASCVAAVFHGSGYIFAALLFAEHVLLARRLPVVALGLLPLATALVIQAHYGQGASELSHLSSLLSPKNLIEFLKACAAYIGSPFQYATPWIGFTVPLVAGFVAMAFTAAVTGYAFARTIQFRLGISSSGTASADIADEFVYAWVLGLALLMSAAAAALLCMVRVRMEPSLISVEPYLLVFTQPRYGAWSCLAYLLLLGTLLALAPAQRAARGAAFLFALALGITGVIPTLLIKHIHTYEESLQESLAGVSLGISPLDPAADGFWPGARDDWYWSKALPETVAYFRVNHKGPWQTLPALHAVADGPTGSTLAISSVQVAEVPAQRAGNRCSLSGQVPDSSSLILDRSTVVPIVDSRSEVIGFGALLRPLPGATVRRVQGFIECRAAADNGAQGLRIVTGNTRWKAPISTSTLTVAPLDVTDAAWHKGVATGWAGFTFPDTPENRQAFVPGAVLRMEGGTVRVIMRTNLANGYLNVFVDGGPLDGTVMGYPHKVEVYQ